MYPSIPHSLIPPKAVEQLFCVRHCADNRDTKCSEAPFSSISKLTKQWGTQPGNYKAARRHIIQAWAADRQGGSEVTLELRQNKLSLHLCSEGEWGSTPIIPHIGGSKSTNCHLMMCLHMKIAVSANWGGPAANLRWQMKDVQKVSSHLWDSTSRSQALLKLLCSWGWPRIHLPASASEVLVLQGHSSLIRLLPECTGKFLLISFREDKKGMKAQNGNLESNRRSYSCNWGIMETPWVPENVCVYKRAQPLPP